MAISSDRPEGLSRGRFYVTSQREEVIVLTRRGPFAGADALELEAHVRMVLATGYAKAIFDLQYVVEEFDSTTHGSLITEQKRLEESGYRVALVPSQLVENFLDQTRTRNVFWCFETLDAAVEALTATAPE